MLSKMLKALKGGAYFGYSSINDNIESKPVLWHHDMIKFLKSYLDFFTQITPMFTTNFPLPPNFRGGKTKNSNSMGILQTEMQVIQTAK